jgi:hypothetical protein
MRTLKMLWNGEAGPPGCRWAESECENSREVLMGLERSGASGGERNQASAPPFTKLNWHLFFGFRQPAFPASGRSGLR